MEPEWLWERYIEDGFKDRVSVLDRATNQTPAAAVGQNREH